MYVQYNTMHTCMCIMLALVSFPMLPHAIGTCRACTFLQPAAHSGVICYHFEPQRASDRPWGMQKKFLTTATSGFGDSDVDVFFWGVSPEASSAKLQHLLQRLHANRHAVRPILCSLFSLCLGCLAAAIWQLTSCGLHIDY